jgi:hypothetical protein
MYVNAYSTYSHTTYNIYPYKDSLIDTFFFGQMYMYIHTFIIIYVFETLFFDSIFRYQNVIKINNSICIILEYSLS